jgi:hypothetical protein
MELNKKERQKEGNCIASPTEFSIEIVGRNAIAESYFYITNNLL